MFYIFSCSLMALDWKIIWRKPIFMKIPELNMQSLVGDPGTEWELRGGEMKESGLLRDPQVIVMCSVASWGTTDTGPTSRSSSPWQQGKKQALTVAWSI